MGIVMVLTCTRMSKIVKHLSFLASLIDPVPTWCLKHVTCDQHSHFCIQAEMRSTRTAETAVLHQTAILACIVAEVGCQFHHGTVPLTLASDGRKVPMELETEVPSPW
jgi:hypothetical protein